MTGRREKGRFARRRAPLLVLCLLIAAAYWLYSLHTSRGSTDGQDTALGLVLTVTTGCLIAYFALRTDPLTPQMLGLIAFMAGDFVLYGTVSAGREGWATFSVERQFDALRACVSVAILVTVGGVVWFEVAQWRERRRRRAEEAMRRKDDVPLYQGPNRRGSPPGRRRTDR
jgi:hypothetical protein